MSERWLPVVGFEGQYAVSDLGRVRSLDREVVTANGATKRLKGKMLAGHANWLGYRYISLPVQGGEKKRKIHILVAEAFIGPRPPQHDVCHRDGDPKNNALSNLYYGTRKENMADSRAHGTMVAGRRCWKAKVDEHAVQDIRALRGVMSLQEIGNLYGLSKPAVSRIARGLQWKHVA
jgi:hypothetical protein